MKRIVQIILLVLLSLCAPHHMVQAKKNRRSQKNPLIAMNDTSGAQIQSLPDPLRSKQLQSDLRKLIEIEDIQARGIAASVSPESAQEITAPANGSDDTSDEELSPEELSLIHRDTPAYDSAASDEKPYIQFNFENADLTSMLKQVETIFDVLFITDEAIDPITKGKNALKGNKITFKTHKPLTKQEGWGLFLTFLDIAGFMAVAQEDPKLYRIITAQDAEQQRAKAPVQAYIGTPYKELPDTDETVRYVYFVENSTLAALTPVVETLKSRDSKLIVLQENKAFLLIDKSYNIKMLMNIIKELDKSTIPQAMSILKLRRADAIEVKKLYDALIQSEQEAARRIVPGAQRKQPTSLYFPENTRIIAEPRTNSLILLGQQESIKKIEEFIVKNVDTDLDQPYYQPYVYTLKYADAKTVADIMTKATNFGKSTPAGIAGGVRGGDKYLQPITFIPQLETNQLIIKGGYDDYAKAKEIIARLDEPQPQVAIEVLILDVTLNDQKSLGTQLRSKEPGINGFWGNNLKFQTSGLYGTAGIDQNTNGPGVDRLLGNLVNLAIGATPGNTILTLGQDIFGVWGILQILETITNVQVISNPFLVATNKTKSTVSVGDLRRVATGTITQGTSGFQSQGDDPANLQVIITPQITSDGMITLDVEVNIDTFTNPDPSSATKSIKKIRTTSIVADKEVLAVGGLIKNTINDSTSKVPILGNIPILGWLFKNKAKTETKTNLLVLISTQIIKPDNAVETQQFTVNKTKEYHLDKNMVDIMQNAKDPVHRMLFADKDNSASKLVDEFLFKRDKKPTVTGISKNNRDEDEVITVPNAQEKQEKIIDPQTVASNSRQRKQRKKKTRVAKNKSKNSATPAQVVT